MSERPERIYIHSGHTPLDKAEYTEYVRADIAANAVRDKCVEKVREMRRQHLELAERLDRQKNPIAGELQRVRAGECERVATALQSLALDQAEGN